MTGRDLAPVEADDEGWGRGRRPVINVAWLFAKDYVAWLSSETGATYRLLSESEWEYAARGGTQTAYSWGGNVGTNRANCTHYDWEVTCGDEWDYTAPVGSFAPNAFGLYDMHGNVWEWVEDCWHDSYEGAPLDGSAWTSHDCDSGAPTLADRVLRGGGFGSEPWELRSAYRREGGASSRVASWGFRVARTLTP